MPLPRRLAEFNKRVTNRLMLGLAGIAPGFAIVTHVGRNSGHEYRTPVNLFRHEDGYLIALTYGRGQWVENVLAAGGCSIETRGTMIELTAPRILRDPDHEHVPKPVASVLDLIDVDEFLTLRRA